MDTSNPLFVRMIACLTRYHYSEWEYHSKLGGTSLEHLLSGQNPIFEYPDGLSGEVENDFIMGFLDDVFEDQQVNIITAYGRDIYNHFPHQAVGNGNKRLLERISQELREQNYFLVEPKYEKNFKNIERIIDSSISKGEIFYRARIGAIGSAINYRIENESLEVFYTPYKGKEIGAPPIIGASSGRINRPGVSYLYLASDINTAVCEVRPHPSELVSVGTFAAKQDLRIADLSRHRISEELMTDEGLDALALVVGIEKYLSTATVPSNNAFYGVSQFVTEVIRNLGFLGILFKSSVGMGRNLVVFDPSSFEWLDNSGEVYEVQTINYTYSKASIFNSGENYDRILNKEYPVVLGAPI